MAALCKEPVARDVQPLHSFRDVRQLITDQGGSVEINEILVGQLRSLINNVRKRLGSGHKHQVQDGYLWIIGGIKLFVCGVIVLLIFEADSSGGEQVCIDIISG